MLNASERSITRAGPWNSHSRQAEQQETDHVYPTVSKRFGPTDLQRVYKPAIKQRVEREYNVRYDEHRVNENKSVSLVPGVSPRLAK